MYETFTIKHRKFTAYRPQMNEVVEATNKNIKKILRKMVYNYKQWHEKLPFSLLRYRTTVHTSTGATPYLPVYGTKAVIPTEVKIPSLRIIHEAELSDAEWIQSLYEQLALIDGKRMNTVCHDQLYRNRMARAFNKKRDNCLHVWGLTYRVVRVIGSEHWSYMFASFGIGPVRYAIVRLVKAQKGTTGLLCTCAGPVIVVFGHVVALLSL
uniref:Uncharacterized protein n=1 Tax=Nicotiana tabacum TaxID=4097 RepID=A0A1S4BEV7_TOBAC|nr:uncharacterized protein LOC104099564 [Nicotiana tomentosiformis]XP_016487429.1 PREDICTED: uncharacterized protein LOC107807536 [Nicotiana tabacum]